MHLVLGLWTDLRIALPDGLDARLVFLAKVLQIVCNLAIVESAERVPERHVCLQGSFLRFPSHHFYRYIAKTSGDRLASPLPICFLARSKTWTI